MKTFPGVLCLLSALFLVGASGAVNAASVPAPIYNEDTTLFGSGPPAGPLVTAANIQILPPVTGNFRFTVTNLGTPGTPFPPFDTLGFTIRENGDPAFLFTSVVPTSTILALTAAQTYFVGVMGAVNPAAFLGSGTFNLEVVQVIPIPAAAVLFSSAIFGLVVVARRRSKPAEIVTA